MNWTQQIDGYCERLGPAFFAEPVNALTNAAFVVVALWLWRSSRGVERVLAAILLAIGVGSWLFHTHATVWAGVADVVPIVLFILVYVFAAHRRFLGWGVPASLAAAALVLPYAAVAGGVFARLPGLSISASYWPVALLIAIYAVSLRRSMPDVARGLGIGAAVLSVSLGFRSIDMAVCPMVPVGTHFAWHLLNATMLGWMITVLRRHRLEPRGAGR